MKKFTTFICVGSLMSTCCAPALGASFVAKPVQDQPGEGGKVFRVVDDGRCINRTTDRVTIGMLEFVALKDASWFHEAKTATLTLQVGLTSPANPTAKKAEAGSNDQQQTSLAKSIKADLTGFDSNRMAHITYETNFFDLYPLKHDAVEVSSISVNVSLLKEQGDSEAVTVLKGLTTAVDKLPIPANPYTSGFQVASTYVTNVIAPLVDLAKGDGNAIGDQQFTLNFGNSNQCASRQDSTGTILVVYSTPDLSKPGTIDIGNTSQYCDLKVPPRGQTFRVLTKKKSDQGGCSSTNDVGYVDLANPYVAFFVNAEAKTSIGAVEEQRAALLRKDAKSRCLAFRIKASRCH